MISTFRLNTIENSFKALWTKPWLAMNPPKKHYRICDSPEFRNVFTQTAKMLNFEAELRRRWEEAQQQERAHFKALLEGQFKAYTIC